MRFPKKEIRINVICGPIRDKVYAGRFDVSRVYAPFEDQIDISMRVSDILDYVKKTHIRDNGHT